MFVLLVLLESVGIVVSLLNLWLWPLIMAVMVCFLNKLYVLWLLGKVRSRLSRSLLEELLCQRLDIYQRLDPSVQAGQMAVAVDQIQDGLFMPILRGITGLIRLAALSCLFYVLGAFQGIRVGLSLVLVQLLISIALIPYLKFFSVQSARWSDRGSRRLVDILASFEDVLLSDSRSFFVSSYEEIVRSCMRYEFARVVLLCLPLVSAFAVAFVLLFLFPWTSRLPSESFLPGWLIGALVVAVLLWVINDLFLAGLRFQSALSFLSSSSWSAEARKPRVRASFSLPVELPLSLNSRIRLDSVSYRYPGRNDFSLKAISVLIPVGSRIALVGRSGSGKTTVAKILLGLLQPTSGCVEVDGAAIRAEELNRWRSSCAFVPQNIPLLEGSIKDNIAFGCPDWLVEDDAVWAALEVASLADEIMALPYGLLTQVGSGGFRLSKGQAQRLSLARAFYRNAALLVIDEPASALGGPNGSSAPEVLDIVARRCTTVVIARRTSTVARCDCIFELDRGRVRAFGSHQELSKSSVTFAEVFGEPSFDV